MKHAMTVFGSILLLSLGSATTYADILAYDGFDYPANFVLRGSSGGIGFSGPWRPGGFNAGINLNYQVESDSLNFSELDTTGNRINTTWTSRISGLTRNLSTPIGRPGTTQYLSFVVRPEGTVGRGQFGGFFGIVFEQLFEPELFVGKPGAGSNNYVLERRGGSLQVQSGVTAVSGVADLLVVKCEFRNGADIFSLYVNPDPTQPEPLIPDAVNSDINLSFVTGLTIYSTGEFSLDELRLGETFEDVTPATIPISVDVKPGSDSNPLNLKSNQKSRGKSKSAGGVLPVAVLTTDDFDASTIDTESLLLGDPDLLSASPIRSTLEDVDDDGDDDLLLHFSIQEMTDLPAIDDKTTSLILTGLTSDGTKLFGFDLVTVK